MVFGVGILGIGAVVLLSFMPEIPALLNAVTQDFKKTLFLRKVPGDAFCHFLAYFSLMLWFTLNFPRRYHSRIGLSFLLMGATIELCQKWFTTCRTCETHDFFANFTGIVLAWFLTGPWIAAFFRQIALLFKRRLSYSRIS